MLDIEIDGQGIQVPEGSTVMDAANRVGAYIPHFCYHKKLSIAANCRMCLVSVEKAPKPLPACATPVTNGMKVATHNDAAVKAQRGVMEFLLINHPLDCPICDQGGECQLQDLAVGYGGSASRFVEEKRVVVNKDLGPLISTDMTRCIHCTRCVRFGQEIAGIMELGMVNRGERSEIMAFVGHTVDSELSGNVIDLCPVGALTSKPFRFSARTWEMSRRKSVSPHDGLGANLIVQVKHNQVMRVLPLESEDVNECWLSDKDRFSYEALNSKERLTRPMVKQDGKWIETDWQAALDYVARALKGVSGDHGPEAIGALVSPHATLEEMYLAQKLVRGLGSGNVDFRVRQSDFAADQDSKGGPWLGMRIAEAGKLDRVLVVGSFLRKDHPLLCQRLRQAQKRGTQISLIHVSADDLAMPVHARALGAPGALPGLLAQVLVALAEKKGATPAASLQPGLAGVRVGEQAQAIADSLAEAKDGGVFLGNLAQQHPRAGLMHALAADIARIAGARLGFLGEAANSVGGYVAGCVPTGAPHGMNARDMIEHPRRAYLLVNVEPELDCADPRAAQAALDRADTVIALSAFRGEAAMAYADCLLPIAPFTETSGTFVNTEGRVQSFNAVVRPLEDARPGWKVLRVLANLLGLQGFDFDTSEQVRDAALGAHDGFVTDRLSNDAPAVQPGLGEAAALERAANVPIYFSDALVRRAAPLQATRDAQLPTARVSTALAQRLGLADGARARVSQGEGFAELEVRVDDTVADGCVIVAAGHASTSGLGPMVGQISVERI